MRSRHVDKADLAVKIADLIGLVIEDIVRAGWSSPKRQRHTERRQAARKGFAAILPGHQFGALLLGSFLWPARLAMARWLSAQDAPKAHLEKSLLPGGRKGHCPAYADIGEAGFGHLGGAIDVPEVHHQRRLEQAFHLGKIQRAEFVPLGENHHPVCARKRFVGVLRVFNIEVLLGFLHALGIVGADMRALGL